MGAGVVAATGDEDEKTRQMILSASGLDAEIGYQLPFSGLSESEADHIGLLYEARAGYDPRAALLLWERMEKQAGDTPPVFMSTHPSVGKQIQRLTALIGEAMSVYKQASGI